MMIIVAVNLISEYVLKDAYSAIASWVTVMLFLLGTVFLQTHAIF